jgi:hypothetical protein
MVGIRSLSLRAVALLALVAGCGREGNDRQRPEGAEPYVIDGALDVDGDAVRLGVAGGTFVDAESLAEGTRVVDLTGSFVVPAFIDSHVHLAYYPVATELPKGGIAGAVDFAAPLNALASPPSGLVVANSGPMITPLLGYPTQSWGAGGYGLEVATPEEAAGAVDPIAACSRSPCSWRRSSPASPPASGWS